MEDDQQIKMLLTKRFSQVLPVLPNIVYGGAAVLASGFACFLPETLNKPLPDTIEDTEEYRWANVCVSVVTVWDWETKEHSVESFDATDLLFITGSWTGSVRPVDAEPASQYKPLKPACRL